MTFKFCILQPTEENNFQTQKRKERRRQESGAPDRVYRLPEEIAVKNFSGQIT